MSNVATDYYSWCLHSYNSKLRTIAVLNFTGYFDESGTHAGSRVIVVAGYVSPEREWRRLEIKWKKRLRREGAKYYHTTDIEAATPRGPYKGWSRLKADRLTASLLPLIRDHIKWGFAVYLLREDWEAVKRSAQIVFRDYNKFPYVLLSKMCIEGLAVMLGKHLPKGEKISFIFERNDSSGKIVDGYNELVKRPAYSSCGAIQIGEKTLFPGLQAADLAAWHYRRFVEQKHGFRDDNHPAVNTVLPQNMELRYIVKKALKEEFQRLERRSLALPPTLAS